MQPRRGWGAQTRGVTRPRRGRVGTSQKAWPKRGQTESRGSGTAQAGSAIEHASCHVAGAVANDNAVATQEGEKEAVTVPERKKAEEARPFILAEALPVVPARIVKRILKGVFVDMAEFLRDNLELERRQAVIEGPPSAALPYRPSRREMPDLLSWIQCFSLFAGVVCSKYPDKAAQLWAYQATMWRQRVGSV